jgi:hypothetical protein
MLTQPSRLWAWGTPLVFSLPNPSEPMLPIRLRTSLILGCCLLGSSLAAPAVAQKKVSEAQQREAVWRSSSHWAQFVDQYGPNWQVEWSDATSTPRSLWGSGIPLKDWRENSLTEARRQAHLLLQEHADLLGLGSSDLRETIGARMHRVWTFKFKQYYNDLEVIGGRADVRVHMVGRVPMLGSTFWSIDDDFETTPVIDASNAWVLAWEELGETPSNARQPAPFTPPRLVIWGDIEANTPGEVSLAWEVAISNILDNGDGKVGRYYVDAHTGKVLGYKNDKHECGIAGCTGGHAPDLKIASPLPAPVNTLVTVMGWTRVGVDAGDALSNVPMPGLELSVPGVGTVTTDENGQFTIDIASATSISVGNLNGRHHSTISGASAPSGSYVVNPGTPATIQLLSSGASTNQAAHTTTSYYIDQTNEFMRSILGNTSQLATASSMGVTININSSCNAYYTSNTINFYQAGGGCSNTAFSTVVAHEWGHGIDDRYGGISQTNGLSEGWGDIIGCYLVDTPDLGSGFQTPGVPLRSGNNTVQYPCSGCGVHTAGQSWMGFAWKLRERLATTLGNRSAAIDLSNNIVLSTIAADATDQQGAVLEVFIADDDDGNLSNGTPNYADLAWAADQHSLPYPGQSSSVPNDECVDAIVLVDGTNGSFTSVGAYTSSPSWGCASGGNDVWFSYTAQASGTLTVSTCNLSGYDTALQMFSGSCGSLSSIVCNDDSCSLQSTVSATVSAGTYYIRVGGYSGATGSFSLDVSGPSAPPSPPAAPSGLGASAVGSSQVDLSWSDNASNETGFEVERSTNGSSFSLAATVGSNVESWSDTGRSANTTYSYRVRAINGGGESSYSNTASATTGGTTSTSYVVTGERQSHGVIIGSFALTHTSDDSYHQLKERTRSRRNSLKYEYKIGNVPSSGTRTLRLQAYRTLSDDNDIFTFQVRSGGSWVTAMTVTKTVDDDQYQTWVLPSGVSGTVRIRVLDSNNSRNAVGEDTLFVDHLEIVAQ